MAKAIPVDANPFREANEQARKQLGLLLSRFEKGVTVAAKTHSKPSRVQVGAKKK